MNGIGAFAGLAGRLAGCALACGQVGRPERSLARDEAVCRLGAVAGERGWGPDVLRAVAGPDADLLFPGGSAELVEAWFDLADRIMIDAARGLDEPRLGRRVRAVILLRLGAVTPDRDAVRRALAVLLAPGHAALLARVMARTVDAIWEAAGDHATGITRQTKRMSLGAIYAQVLLFWLARGDDSEAVAEFLDRRLAGVVRLGRAKQALLARLRPGRAQAA
ncbi:ubiquinone biosynthesis protein COQ9 [Gluconacetobacter takamatsuzukensis]|uniref:RpsU-divergently transcribed protein n=1 Tax=Gluconacetobacter takamatsuzukensis TaxID=1286190 RepID=A0A7W4KG07_9PROT|nr:rpsU-divergently transcribed protein [Gluconacetobacter takamatsuzukensis]MBB2206145.1 rpsU-divergently transcribed protein [Gluconacetobacter takamatsuzukensis]